MQQSDKGGGGMSELKPCPMTGPTSVVSPWRQMIIDDCPHRRDTRTPKEKAAEEMYATLRKIAYEAEPRDIKRLAERALRRAEGKE